MQLILATVDITHANLRALAIAGTLVPYTFYKITDFQTIYDQPDYDISGNAKTPLTLSGPVIPIIVQAISTNELSEEAFGYDGVIKMGYDINEIATEINGSPMKGRINYMLDINRNESYYDHQNILLKRYETSLGSGDYINYKDTGFASANLNTFGGNDNKLGSCFNWSDFRISNVVVLGDANILSIDVYNSTISGSDNIIEFDNDGIFISGTGNKIGQDCTESFIDGWNNVIYGGSGFNSIDGEGNIIYQDSNTNVITGDYNVIAQECNGNTITGNDNKVSGSSNDILGGDSNIIGIKSDGNTLNNNCDYNKIGNLSSNNTFGTGSEVNEIGDLSSNNTFGTNCDYNILMSGSSNNTFGNTCQYNVLYRACSNNVFALGCNNNSLGINNDTNNFGANCTGNVLGTNCSNNIFGAGSSGNTLGNGATITFGTSSSYNKFGENCTTITVNASVQYLEVGNNISSRTFTLADSNYVFQKSLQNITTSSVTTTNATITDLYLLTPSDGIYGFETIVTGYETATGDTIVVKGFAGFKVVAGVVTQISTQTTDRKSNFPAGVTITIDTNGTLIRLRVTGRTGSSILWNGHITITK